MPFTQVDTEELKNHSQPTSPKNTDNIMSNIEEAVLSLYNLSSHIPGLILEKII